MIVVGLREHFFSCCNCHRLSYVHGHNVHDTPVHQYLGHKHYSDHHKGSLCKHEFCSQSSDTFLQTSGGNKINVLGCVLLQT